MLYFSKNIQKIWLYGVCEFLWGSKEKFLLCLICQQNDCYAICLTYLCISLVPEHIGVWIPCMKPKPKGA